MVEVPAPVTSKALMVVVPETVFIVKTEEVAAFKSWKAVAELEVVWKDASPP